MSAGYPKQQEIAGRWCLPYKATLNNNGFAALDLRSATYFGACPWMPAEQQALAATTGVLKGITIRMLSTSVASSVSIAFESAPGQRYVTIDTANALNLQFPKEQKLSILYLDTGAANADLEMLLYFDLESE